MYDKVVRENLIWHNGKLIVEDEALSFCTEKWIKTYFELVTNSAPSLFYGSDSSVPFPLCVHEIGIHKTFS